MADVPVFSATISILARALRRKGRTPPLIRMLGDSPNGPAPGQSAFECNLMRVLLTKSNELADLLTAPRIIVDAQAMHAAERQLRLSLTNDPTYVDVGLAAWYLLTAHKWHRDTDAG